ncbi:MAG TPA: LuxR C-terminal-related transcriptional regulator [Nocardioidaceae bacterium]|nr:LuxR C-terminal-related transcriptional regulator [Nocardioidaceae bacterium]
MTAADLDHARAAFAELAWGKAHAHFAEADRCGALSADDLDLFARTALLVGADEEGVDLLERAYEAHLAEGAADTAAESAFWAALNLMHRGEMARAGGWLSRARQGAAEGTGSAVSGLVLVPTALERMMQGDPEAALATFEAAEAIGRRAGHPELLALAGLGIGQARVELGDVKAGMTKLDEVMLAVTGGHVSPIASGVVYCAVILACRDVYDVTRAAQWTRALDRWCTAQPDLVPFRGQCLVHRAQILQLNGSWSEALEQVVLACRIFAEPPGQWAAGMALYERAELDRLRGEPVTAEEAYVEAGRYGHETQPGLALLRLAQGRIGPALAGIRRAVDEANAPDRPRLLAAYVEIGLAAHELADARRAADELAVFAGRYEVPLLDAMSAHASGAVLMAEGKPREALDLFRRAGDLWRELDAPYWRARTRILVATACRQLEDVDAARMELDAAAEEFRRLGAQPDLDALERFEDRTSVHGPLTAREVEVLRAVATGKTNRAVAQQLFLSEKTVARHVSNIFTKLDLASRAAATAYAYEHGLLERRTPG